MFRESPPWNENAVSANAVTIGSWSRNANLHELPGERIARRNGSSRTTRVPALWSPSRRNCASRFHSCFPRQSTAFGTDITNSISSMAARLLTIIGLDHNLLELAFAEARIWVGLGFSSTRKTRGPAFEPGSILHLWPAFMPRAPVTENQVKHVAASAAFPLGTSTFS